MKSCISKKLVDEFQGCGFPALHNGRDGVSLIRLGVIAAGIMVANGVIAQEGGLPGAKSYGLEEIVVTAQKRSQSINDVPMSITAATGEQLELAGIKDLGDLSKITPGFSFGKSNIGTPVYTIRGIGYNDVAIAARPAVTVYLDEALIPFSNETLGVGFDVERVEVLKGPQGTLFGNNSTGGAINYIARKPTEEFEAGITATYGRFDQFDVEGYVSGALSDTVRARLALQHQSMDGWQESYTRDDTHGEKDFTNARFILQWDVTDKLQSQLTLNYWSDKSDLPASQVFNVAPQVPPLVPLTPVGGVELAPTNPRDADWDANPRRSSDKDNDFFQAALRLDYEINDSWALTSLTNYIDYEQFQSFDSDGVDFESVHNPQDGDAENFSQELRFTGTFDNMSTVLGFFYAQDEATDDLTSLISEGTLAYAFGPIWESLSGRADQETDTWAVFANLEYKLTDNLTVQGGIRYTDVEVDAVNCGADYGDGNAAMILNLYLNNFLRAPATLPPVPAPGPGECASFSLETLTHQSGKVDSLEEDNVSWRLGLNYEPSDTTLLYASVAKGFKGGGFSSFGSLFSDDYFPATQEEVLAYELGFKSTLSDTLQLNGAVFYSDYEDKQLLGNFDGGVLGTIARLDNVPESVAQGVELQLIAAPVEGLTLSLAGSYVDTEITDDYFGRNADQDDVNFKGTKLPYAPKVDLVGIVRYEFPLGNELIGFVGGNVSHKSETWSYLGEVDIVRIAPRTLLDLQAGVESTDGSWRAYAWGKNVTDKYYWHASARLLDTAVRLPGMGATYGVTVSYNFR